MFVSAEQQINGGIDEWLWFPNEALHGAVRCNTEQCCSCFYLGASSSPPWPRNHNTACGCITVRTAEAEEVSAWRFSSPLCLCLLGCLLICFLYTGLCTRIWSRQPKGEKRELRGSRGVPSWRRVLAVKAQIWWLLIHTVSLSSCSHCFKAEASGRKTHMHSKSRLVQLNYLIEIKDKYDEIAELKWDVQQLALMESSDLLGYLYSRGPFILSFNTLSPTSLWCLVIHWANGHLQSLGMAQRGSVNSLNCLL